MSELDPLLPPSTTNLDGNGESFDNVPKSKRQLGLFSAVFLIFNRIIGTGIYATPGVILRSSGSVGMALVMWLIGASIAALGTAVYVELGTGLPRSGGEKNYLEFIYRRPKFFISCVFVVYAIITGTSSANSVVFGEYVINAINLEPTRFNIRFTAVLCLTFICFTHGTHVGLGLRLQNTLGVLKIFVLSLIALSGLLSLTRFPGFIVSPTRNLEWSHLWESNGKSADANAFVTGLYNVIWSYVGYSNANYALSEIKDPVRTIKRAAPLALVAVTAVYLLVNIAYFAVVQKNEILESKRIVAALFFRNLFGEQWERGLSVFIAMSLLGNMLSGQFAQGRVIQELGREGIVPFPSFIASNKPFNAPLAGLFTQYIVSCAFVLGPPPGDAYLFMISLSSYCLALINTFVSLGLLLLYTNLYASREWSPPFKAPKIVVVLFFLSNIFLVVIPLVPPRNGSKTYEHLPYWSHPVFSLSISLVGVAYWYMKFVYIPKRNGYVLKREWVMQEDGVPRCVLRNVPN